MYLLPAYTRALKGYDRDLFAGLTKDGVPCVFRKSKRLEYIWLDDETRLGYVRDDKQLIFALTDTWGVQGKPRNWGIDDVLGRIRKLDCWANNRFLEDLDDANAKVDASEKRQFLNEAEAFLKDNRKEFAKAFDTTYGTTTSLSKDEPKKRLKDRSIKNG